MPRKRARDSEDAPADEPVKTPTSKRIKSVLTYRKPSSPLRTPSKPSSKKTPSRPSPLKTPSKPPQATPSKSSILKTPLKSARKSQAQINGQPDTQAVQNVQLTPTSKKKVSYATPTKPLDDSNDGETITIVRNADRSARRKAARNFIERTVAGEGSEDELEGNSLARQIWDEEGAQEDTDSEDEEVVGDGSLETENIAPETPSKRGRGRPKGAKRKRTPTPPPDLAPHEQYFFQNRPSRAKSSSNTLSSASILSHAAYHNAITAYNDPHASSIDDLHAHHATNFPLWAFELSQGFSVCLHGYGSKRRVLTSFASYLHSKSPGPPPTTILINGHHPNLTIRGVLNTVARALLPKATKLTTQPASLLAQILFHITAEPPPSPTYLLLSTLHTRPLITAPAPTILSQLASHPNIHLLATADNPSFPLLHPTSLRSAFNFLYHDATTFLPYSIELGTVVDSVLDLIGRKTSGVTGREGIRWVLKSLSENARNLYRILVGEILATEADNGMLGGEVDAEDGIMDDGYGNEGEGEGRIRSKGATGGELPGVDAKTIYEQARTEFVCSSEMAFWSLLKEFRDHQMVVVRREKGALGGEMLGIEMGREELEGVLEDLVR